MTAGGLGEDLLVPEADGWGVEQLGGELADMRVDDGFGEDGLHQWELSTLWRA